MEVLFSFLMSFLPIGNPVDPSILTCIQGKSSGGCWSECYYSNNKIATDTQCAHNGTDYTCTKCTHTDAIGNYCTISHSKKCPYG